MGGALSSRSGEFEKSFFCSSCQERQSELFRITAFSFCGRRDVAAAEEGLSSLPSIGPAGARSIQVAEDVKVGALVGANAGFIEGHISSSLPLN